METTWGRQDPGGPNVYPMNIAPWVAIVGDKTRGTKSKYLDLTKAVDIVNHIT